VPIEPRIKTVTNNGAIAIVIGMAIKIPMKQFHGLAMKIMNGK